MQLTVTTPFGGAVILIALILFIYLSRELADFIIQVCLTKLKYLGFNGFRNLKLSIVTEVVSRFSTKGSFGEGFLAAVFSVPISCFWQQLTSDNP